MNEERSGVIWGLLLFLVLAVLLAATLWVHGYQLSRETVYGDAIDMAVRPLRVERQRLEDELAALEQQLSTEQQGMGVNTFIFTQLSGDIYELAYPIAKENGFGCTLAISDTEYPGAEDCLSVEQCRELLDAGWTLCIYWGGSEELSAYLEKIDPILDTLGEKRPTVLLCASGIDRKACDADYLAAGFSIVVNHGEEETPIICRIDGDEVWRVQTLAWNRAGIKGYMKRACDYGGTFAMNLDFSERRSGFDAELFGNMCAYMKLQGNHAVMPLPQARTYRDQLQVNEKLYAEIEWYRNEIAEINREISEIYGKN